MTSSYSKASVFVRPQKKSDKPAFLKNSTLRTLLLNMCFWYPRTPFTCGGKVETEKRVRLRMKKYRHTCGRDLNIVLKWSLGPYDH